MHILPLNLFKFFVEELIRKSRATDLDRALEEITIHRPKQLGARWPTNCSNRLSYWTAEEYQHFVQWCLPYCMEKLRKEVDDFRSLHLQLSDLEKQNIRSVYKLFEIGQILTEIARLFFSHARTHGWSESSIKQARTLLSAWRIK